MTEGIFVLIVLFFSIVIHEIAHGTTALYLGDPTAKYAGRLTLNPLKHLDPIGSVILPLFLFFSYSLAGTAGPIVGWAKPVPVNPLNFKDRKWGSLKVALAGPAINFAIAIIFGLALRLPLSFQLDHLFSIITVYNFAWGLFNLVPIPPLDGSWILFTLLPERWNRFKMFLSQHSLLFLILFVFIGVEWIFRGALILYALVRGG